MFHPNYPNLELLAYKAKLILQNDAEYLKKCEQSNLNPFPELDAQVFPQIWGSTSLGFGVMPDGSPTIGGCAMCKAYTSVFHELKTDIYIVFFGERQCYRVSNATKEFLDDLKDHNLTSLSKAMTRY